MNKIKVIDLLNIISKGQEVPKKIWLRRIWRVPMTYSEEAKDYYCINNPNGFFEDYFKSYYKADFNLNEEVEIIEEEKEIEELPIIKNADNTTSLQGKDFNYTMKTVDVILANKINELIYELNELRKEK